jgi:hypothetical protein
VVKNSAHFIQILNSIHIQPTDLMVSFDVVSLFTKVPIEDSLQLLSIHFENNILALFKHVLTSTYFSFDGQFYEQTDGVAMGSPLSPVRANFFMEDFETKALHLTPHKPTHWLRYVDDTFIIWPHGQQRLTEFLDHLNSLHPKIQFTMETEKYGHLPFLDVDIYRRLDDTLGHKVYRKTTHPNIYLQQDSHHHPANKFSSLSSLFHRAHTIVTKTPFPKN